MYNQTQEDAGQERKKKKQWMNERKWRKKGKIYKPTMKRPRRNSCCNNMIFIFSNGTLLNDTLSLFRASNCSHNYRGLMMVKPASPLGVLALELRGRTDRGYMQGLAAANLSLWDCMNRSSAWLGSNRYTIFTLEYNKIYSSCRKFLIQCSIVMTYIVLRE